MLFSQNCMQGRHFMIKSSTYGFWEIFFQKFYLLNLEKVVHRDLSSWFPPEMTPLYIMYIRATNSRFHGSFPWLNMKCSLVCRDHFLYKHLPKKTSMKEVIILLILTFFFWHLLFVLTKWCVAAGRRRLTTNSSTKQMSKKSSN